MFPCTPWNFPPIQEADHVGRYHVAGVQHCIQPGEVPLEDPAQSRRDPMEMRI